MRFVASIIFVLTLTTQSWGADVHVRLVREFLACLDKDMPTLADYERFQGQLYDGVESEFEILQCAMAGWPPLVPVGDRMGFSQRCEQEKGDRADSATTQRSYFLSWLKWQIPDRKTFTVVDVRDVANDPSGGLAPSNRVTVCIGNSTVVFDHVYDPNYISTFGEFSVLSINSVNVYTYVKHLMETMLGAFTMDIER